MHIDKNRDVTGDRHTDRHSTAVDSTSVYRVILNKDRVWRINRKLTGLFLDIVIGRFCQQLDETQLVRVGKHGTGYGSAN